MADCDHHFRTYARLYDRNMLVTYIAGVDGTSVSRETLTLRRIIDASGHAGLIDMLRDRHAADPEDQFIRAALFAEERALLKSREMLASFPAELAELEADLKFEIRKDAA